MSEPLLEADELTIEYRTDQENIVAVSDASFSIDEGEYFGLVGESGCGKSTIAKSVIGGLDDNGLVTSGTLRYKGTEIQDMSDKELNETIRWDEIALIPQSSMNSLDPLQRISEQAFEIASVHTDMDRGEVHQRLEELFDIMGLQTERISDYPHQFSGGMQQRAMIALSLLLNPSLIIADEPTTALDVVMQDQIFSHLMEFKDEFDASMLLITHDISLVLESCSRMGVMHAGQIAELGSVNTLHESPTHPYTIQLQGAFPDIRYPDRELEIIEGGPPQNRGEVTSCTFADRCPWEVPECSQGAPALETVDGDDEHLAACIRKDEIGDAPPQEEADQLSGGASTNVE